MDQYEAPAMAKIGSTYYLFGSYLTGWSTDDNQYTTASSITGTWSSWRGFAPPGTNTCNSRATAIRPISGSSTTSYLFLGDRWNSGNLADSRYIWEPLTISGTTVSMTCRTSWTVDTATGVAGRRSDPRPSARHVRPCSDLIDSVRTIARQFPMDVPRCCSGAAAPPPPRRHGHPLRKDDH